MLKVSVWTGGLLFIAGLLLLALLAACQPAQSGVTESFESTATVPVPAVVITATVAPPQPVVMATVAAPPSPTSALTATPTTEAVASPAIEESPQPTATPAPTFTPPPPPPVLEGQQLWLQRPVPLSGPAWTDKAYPYGSTRGGALRPHTGVEFVVPSGTPVLAVSSGTVVFAGSDAAVAYGPHENFYGNLVIIQLDSTDATPLYALYGHLSEVSVAAGQQVARGEVLGLSGASGVADGPHLHFEVRIGQNNYTSTRNPLLWLEPLAQTGIVAGRIVNPGGQILYEAPISLMRVDATAPYTATTSYANGEPNGDPVMAENFVIDDVVPGYYQAIVDTGSRQIKSDLWVYPGRVNWIEIVVSP